MKVTFYRFITFVLITFWNSPLLALTTLQIDFSETSTYCSSNMDSEVFWNDLDYLSDTITSENNFSNSFGSFIYNGITINMGGDIVYSAIPMKFRVDRETVISVSQDREYASTPIPEPTSILLLGTGILCVVGIGRKLHPNKRNDSESQEMMDDYIEEMNYCEYLIENELESIILAEEELD